MNRQNLDGRRIRLVLLAFLAPFYFVFPGSVWEDATPKDRRLARGLMAAGAVFYLIVLWVLFASGGA